MRFATRHLTVVSLALLAGCGDINRVGRAPEFSPMQSSYEQEAMYSTLPQTTDDRGPTDHSSLWTSQRTSLLGDHRARTRGDILTVVVEIDDQAQFSDTTGRTRTGAEQMGTPSLFGIPQRLGAGTDDLIATSSSSTFNGTGAIARNEKVTLRLAVTVVEELPNGVLRLEGQQEVRLNNEMRQLTINGYVRPDDISRQNEITYDKIAQAQISYGGRGTISDAMQPRYGQQLIDQLAPF
ncbi:MAG: flagellar basal body L-ring protein FlgH [Candidatus Saccharibacteria bacterium]|nr:flagellar basal body L-ring protein FlgH [Pseudorhodobacter sp.]